MKISWKVLRFILLMFYLRNHVSIAQDYDEPKEEEPASPPPAVDECNGIYVSYEFISRTKGYPRLKNATAQSWSFNSTATVVNTGADELKAWKIFIGFQHKEILVSASGAVSMDGDSFPASVGNGTFLSGSPQADLKTSIDTAGDFNQMQAQIQMSGTQFGVKPPAVPMPKTIKLVNDGYKCPAPTRKKTSMHICCKKDPKLKAKVIKTKFLRRQNGDLIISYDITQSYANNYLAQVTLENKSPLGRLDHWNLTWEWMRGEFIYTMKGAFTRNLDFSGCLYGEAGTYYGEMDFSKVMNCEKRPTISDLPREKANDTEIGKIPYCCRNGSLLPTIMDPSQSKSVFQVQVFKLPPDLNRTAFYPPEKWKIVGVLNPTYKCGQPIRVDPTKTPDPSGLQAIKSALASWQVVCNITKPTKGKSKCCVSFSAYYNESIVPCNTCACGCPDTTKCNPEAPALLLPAEAILVPFENRTQKAKAWASLRKLHVPRRMPCGDNCGVSINWHISTDYKGGWSARVTLFNWERINFENWFTALQFKKSAKGYEKFYSFNATMLSKYNNTIFFQGLEGSNYLMGETNATPTAMKVPGKQQSVVSFTKSRTPNINVPGGDGFPSKVLFNGEECALPKRFPIAKGNRLHVNMVQVIVLTLVIFLLIK